MRRGFVESFPGQEDVPQVVVGHGEGAVDGNGLPIACLGLVKASQFPQGVSPVGVSFGKIRFSGDSAVEKVESGRVVLPLQRHDPQEMECLDIARLEGDDLPVDALGRFQVSGLMVAQGDVQRLLDPQCTALAARALRDWRISVMVGLFSFLHELFSPAFGRVHDHRCGVSLLSRCIDDRRSAVPCCPREQFLRYFREFCKEQGGRLASLAALTLAFRGGIGRVKPESVTPSCLSAR